MVDKIIEVSNNALTKGLAHIDNILKGLPAGNVYRDDLNALKNRTRALICIGNNLVNGAEFQSILDLTDRSEPPVDKSPVWFMQGNVLLYRIKAVFRREIDNTIELINILENSANPIFSLSTDKHDEDVGTLGCDIVDQLKKKIRIMEDHRDDFNRLYMNYNR